MPVVSTHGPAGAWCSLIRLRFNYLWHFSGCRRRGECVRGSWTGQV